MTKKKEDNGSGTFGCLMLVIILALVVMWIYSVKYMYGKKDFKAELTNLTEKDGEYALTFTLDDGLEMIVRLDEEAYAELKRKLSNTTGGN